MPRPRIDQVAVAGGTLVRDGPRESRPRGGKDGLVSALDLSPVQCIIGRAKNETTLSAQEGNVATPIETVSWGYRSCLSVLGDSATYSLGDFRRPFRCPRRTATTRSSSSRTTISLPRIREPTVSPTYGPSGQPRHGPASLEFRVDGRSTRTRSTTAPVPPRWLSAKGSTAFKNVASCNRAA